MDLSTRIHVARLFLGLAGRLPASHLLYLARRMRNEKPRRFAGRVRINTFFPPHPSPAFDRFVDALVRRRRVPFSTYLAVTGECPFSCPHCSAAGRRGEAMTLTQLLDSIRQIKSIGATTLGLTGGEPLLCEGLPELVRAAQPEMATVVFTSGEGLGPEKARGLAAAGVDCVTVGIESSNASEHDRVRGREGSFRSAREALRALREAGAYPALSTIGSREKIRSGELDRIYETAKDWGAGELRILSPVATGGLAGCVREMLAGEDLEELSRFHIRKNRLRDGPSVACFAYLESEGMFGCGAGYHHLYIDASGEVCPCDLTPLSFGNLTREPLAEIWERLGRHFPEPRRGCLMGKIAGEVGAALSRGGCLPLPPDQSSILCPARPPGGPLPEGYRRLLLPRSYDRELTQNEQELYP